MLLRWDMRIFLPIIEVYFIIKVFLCQQIASFLKCKKILCRSAAPDISFTAKNSPRSRERGLNLCVKFFDQLISVIDQTRGGSTTKTSRLVQTPSSTASSKPRTNIPALRAVTLLLDRLTIL